MGRTRRSALTEPACYHITHRCQERRFLLKFALDRRNYLRRLRQMAETYPVSVLDYMVTCNHVHLLLWARRGGEGCRSAAFPAGQRGPRLQPAQEARGSLLARALPSDADRERPAPVALPVLH